MNRSNSQPAALCPCPFFHDPANAILHPSLISCSLFRVRVRYRRLARRGGVLRMKSEIYDEIRVVIRKRVTEVSLFPIVLSFSLFSDIFDVPLLIRII